MGGHRGGLTEQRVGGKFDQMHYMHGIHSQTMKIEERNLYSFHDQNCSLIPLGYNVQAEMTRLEHGGCFPQ